MKAPQQSDRTVTTNFTGGSEFAMGIHEDAMEMVMESLAGLYSDQITAMLREYATNAIDAHIMAGVTRPIEVTLPKTLQPTLSIRDYGIGLDEADLRLIYSQYGASTKRDSNDFNGMLGFGCKSALAYSDVFNVTSVKDGVKTFCAVSREDGGAKFRVLDKTTTSEGNGTTVEIPVGDRRDQSACAEKAAKLYAYFEKGTVLVDGVAPKPFEFDSQVDDHTWITKRDRYTYSDQPSFIVMGNVPYPAPIQHGLAEGYGVVIKVPIGAVEFTPSREALKLNKTSTKQTIASLEARLHKHLQTIVQREVDAAATPLDAIEVVKKWRAALRFDPNPDASPLKYRGRAIPNRLSAGVTGQKDQYGRDIPKLFTFVQHNAHKLAAHQNTQYVDAAALKDCIWVKNFDQAGFTPTTKKKMQAWADNRSRTINVPAPRSWVLTSGEPPEFEFWAQDNVILDWNTDLKPIKLATATVGGSYYRPGRPTGSYEGWVDGNYGHVVAGDIDTSKPVYYYHGNKGEASRYEGTLQTANPNGYTFIHMPGNRIDKFKRDFPAAVYATQGCQNAYKAWAATLSADQRKAMFMDDQGWTDSFRVLGRLAGTIDDPAVREAVRIAKVNVEPLKKAQRAFRYVVGLSDLGVRFDNPLARYPLIHQATSYGNLKLVNQGHIMLYLNQAYAAYKRGALK